MTDPAGIIRLLNQCTSCLISVHKNPDGDALGSQLGLLFALEKLGKKVTAHNLDPVPEIYRFLPGADRITSGAKVPGSFDAVIVLDCDPMRTGLFDGGYPSGTLINIDHHVTNPLVWQHTWLEPDATATGEMIYQIVTLLGNPLDRDIALCLYTAIFTDTGSFRYSSTTAQSLRIAANLMEAGADPWHVTENVYESFSFNRMKLLGHVLSGMERTPDGRIASVVITDEMFRDTGTTAEDTDNFVNYLRSVKGVEVALFMRQTGERQYKISLRSKGRADMSSLAQRLGGGGHKNAAGAVMDGSLQEVRDRVIGEVSRLLNTQLGPAVANSK